MKCKKYNQAWFDNKYIQILNMQLDPTKKLQKLHSFFKLAKEHGIIPKKSKESKVKYIREDFGIQKTARAIRARKSKLKRKRKQKKIQRCM